MKALLDTNILIHREASKVVVQDIGKFFNWLDRLKIEKWVHPSSLAEIRKHDDPSVVATFEAKLQSYNVLPTIAPDAPEITAIRSKYDRTVNDQVDTSLLNEVFTGRVDILITEDRKMHRKALDLGISDRVFTINVLLERFIADNPDIINYKILAVKKEYFSNIRLDDRFFDSFKKDYPGFAQWFNKKANEIAYICRDDNDDSTLAFLYIKTEDADENYGEIEPRFTRMKRLKIGTFKVELNGLRLGERFLRIIFENAILQKVDEIYLTIFDKTEEQKRLIELVEEWGFHRHGVKHTVSGDELVYVRSFKPSFDSVNPKLSYPYIWRQARKFIVPIYPEYHTELFPDSILRTESPNDYRENRPNRNAISKVYISRSIERNLVSGDIIVFYRTKEENQLAHYSAVTTTVGIVLNVIANIPNFETFKANCKNRSVFSDEKLREHWDYRPSNRPVIVNFLYIFSFPKRINRKDLLELGILSDRSGGPRGFERMDDAKFELLMEQSDANKRYVVD